MKILLVNTNQYKLPVPAMPFGLCLLASSLDDAGHEVKILDLCFTSKAAKKIEKTIKEFQPAVVGASIRNIDTVAYYNTYFQLETVKENVIEPLKKAFQGPIVIGGTAVGILGVEILKYLGLKYAIRGDGEVAMVEFVNRVEKNKSLAGMSGLTWCENGKVVEENPPLHVEDLDQLPLAMHFRYINVDKYRLFRAPIQIQTKRGCALNCTYCAYNIVEGCRYRLRDPQKIAEEIEIIFKATGNNHFEFSDSTFNIPLDHSKEVLRAIIKKNLKGLNLCTMGINPGAVDDEYANLLKEAQFINVEVGAEAGNNKMLKALGKNFTKDDIFRTAEALHKVNMPIMWYILTGAPGESKETLMETAETMNEAASPWDIVIVLNGVRVNKGTPLAKYWLKENPNCTKDNFLTPVFYSSDVVDLDAIRTFNKLIAFQHPNHLFPEEVQRVPLAALRFQTFVMRHFAPKQPWWRFNIALNRIQKAMGIYYIRKKRFESRHKHLLENLAPGTPG
jgi:radical SAM superfamily enzyme YgiQ (UPF0313 family)